MAELLDRCLAEYATRLRSGELKPRTLKGNTWIVQKYLKPAFGKRRVSFVTRVDVKRFKESMSATPILFNRCRSVLCATFDLADDLGIGLSEPNPARKVKPFKEEGRKRALKGHEIIRLGAALRECEAECVISPAVAACFRLLILTGCRRDEVRTLHWGDVDYEGRCLHLRDSKTGPRDVPLPAAALQVLADLDRGPDERLFPTRSSTGYVSLHHPWHRVCARAGLEDVTLHTLRHTWVTTGISSGLSVKLV